MAEKRTFKSVICVKIGAKTMFKIELFPAAQWSESAQGRYRLRINRRWHDLPDGGHAYLDLEQAYLLAATLAKGQDIKLPPAPGLPRGTSVSVASGRSHCDIVWRDVTRTITPPILGHDGRWYVGILSWARGVEFVAVDDLIILPPKSAGGKRRVKGG